MEMGGKSSGCENLFQKQRGGGKKCLKTGWPLPGKTWKNLENPGIGLHTLENPGILQKWLKILENRPVLL